MGADGSGVRGAIVSLTSSPGLVRTTTSNAFGYYTFDSVQSGGTFVMRATAKRYSFGTRAVVVTDSLTDVNFIDGQ